MEEEDLEDQERPVLIFGLAPDPQLQTSFLADLNNTIIILIILIILITHIIIPIILILMVTTYITPILPFSKDRRL